MSRLSTSCLIAALALAAGPIWAQDAPPLDAPALADEAATDIEVVNGVPVNPELRELLSQDPGKRSVEDLIRASNDLLQEQQDQVAEQEQQANAQWLDDPFNHLEAEMGDLANYYGAGQTDDSAQALGSEIEDKLGQLITLLEEMANS